MSYFGWKPYVSAAERRRKAELAAARYRKLGKDLSPVPASSGAIARTFWGKAWCDNLERYSDYANRLPRGRTYLRNGSVIDLKIGAGQISAQVMGSSLYKVEVTIAAVAAKHWKALGSDCAGSIASLIELLQGRLSEAVMERICRPASGLFPSQGEIEFRCSCPDWADMCKHVAAVFYGIGARLDKQPELLFTLRCVDAKDLVARAGTLTITGRKPASARTLADSKLADVFGIDITDIATPGAKRAAKPVARLNPRLKVPAAEKKPAAPAKKKARSRNTPSGSTGRGTSIRARKGAGK